MPPVDVEDVARELKHLEADVREGRRSMYVKIADVEAKVGEVKQELHGLVSRTEEREKNHDQRHADLKERIKEVAESVKKQESATAAFNAELLTAIRQNRPPSESPMPPALAPSLGGKTFADHLNALDWRWTAALILVAALLSGGLSSGALDKLVNSALPAPTAPASTAGPQGPPQ